MDKNSMDVLKQTLSSNSIKTLDKENKNSEIKTSINSDSISFDKLFTLGDEKQFNSEIINEPEKNEQKLKTKEDDFENKISLDLSDVNNKKIHNFLNEDLIDAIDKCLDEPIDNPEFSHNENDTNYSQNNISNDNDLFNNNYSNMNNNKFQFYPQMNSVHNTISFFPKTKKKEDDKINTNNNNNKVIENNKNDKNKGIKRLVDYFGGSNPLDAPVYIPQKFKSIKFNQRPNKIGDNIVFDNNSENNETKKEEKCKKPFEIREGDWTCEFCYNLNFAFRTKCNRCGLIKDFLQIKNNLCINNNDKFQNCQNLIKSNPYKSSQNFQFNNFSNSSLFSPNISNNS